MSIMHLVKGPILMRAEPLGATSLMRFIYVGLVEPTSHEVKFSVCQALPQYFLTESIQANALPPVAFAHS